MWKVPMTTIQHPTGNPNEFLNVPFLRPVDMLGFLMKNCPDLLLGGHKDFVRSAKELSCFWTQYKKYHPQHMVFESGCPLDTTVPILLHGDEGRGLRRGNTAILTLESPLGLGTSKG